MFKKYKEKVAALEAEIEALEHRKAQIEMELHDREYEKQYMEEVVLNKYKYAILVGHSGYPPIL